MSYIIEVNSDRWLVKELNTFHPNSKVFCNYLATFDVISTASSSIAASYFWTAAFETVDAVFLIRLIALRQDNLLQATWSCFSVLYILFQLKAFSKVD